MATKTEKIYVVNVSSAKVYSFPNSTSKVVGTLSRGTQLTGSNVTTANGTYFKIKSLHNSINNSKYNGCYLESATPAQYLITKNSKLYTAGVFSIKDSGKTISKNILVRGTKVTINGKQYLKISGTAAYNNKYILFSDVTIKANPTKIVTTAAPAVNANNGQLLGGTLNAKNSSEVQAQLNNITKSKQATTTSKKKSTNKKSSSSSSNKKSTSTEDKKKVSAESQVINTTSDGISETTDKTAQELLYMDDHFTVVYGNNTLTNETYRSNIDGLKIKDIRGILGCPHQYMPIADMRIDGTKNESGIGRLYAERIIKHMPLLLITPGVPTLLSSASDNQKKTIVQALLGKGLNSDLENLFSKCSGKYYSLKYSYTEYFYYVNAMLRAAAYFLEIQTKTIDGRKLSDYNWMYYTTDPNNSGSDIFGHEGLGKFLGPYAGCIAMYADCGNNVDDSFTNNTAQSNLSSMVNGVSEQARELNFMVGNIGGVLGLQLNRLTSMENLDSNISEFTGLVDNIVGHKNGLVSRVVGQVQTLLAGGRMVFPEIWTDSSFSRSYNCKMKLVSPSGDKLSIYLNILVPIYHLLGLVLPRQGSGQTYYSPFLVRAYCKSLFNVDMGIITDLSITKGEEGEWTKDGLPTVADISFTIKDLYDDLFMSKYENPFSPTGIMSNISELDYIANSCGVNVNDQDIGRMVKMYGGLWFGNVRDKIDIGIFGNISQYFNQKLNDIFGVF